MKTHEEALDLALASALTQAEDNNRSIIKAAVETYLLARGEQTVPTDPIGGPVTDPIPPVLPNPDFMVFEDINYRGRPDLQKMGMKPIQIHYESAFFDDKARPGAPVRMPKGGSLAAAAKNAGEFSVIDIERWWSDDHSGQTPPNEHGIRSYEAVARTYKASLAPGKQFGFYGTLPTRNYWGPVNGEPKLSAWKRGNDVLAPIGELVDFTCPSIYTFYEDREGWMTYAEAQVSEAKRLSGNKPCYPFLWPEYHPGKGPIEKDYFRMQLEFCADHADGVVIWTLSSTKSIDFDDIPDWWGAVEEFLDEL